MASEQSTSSPEGSLALEAPSPPRPVTQLLTVGFVLLVVGVLLLVAAVHESLYFAALATSGVPVTCGAEGVCEPAQSNAPFYSWSAILALTAASILLGRSVRELGRRSDAAAGAVRRDIQWGVEAAPDTLGE